MMLMFEEDVGTNAGVDIEIKIVSAGGYLSWSYFTRGDGITFFVKAP